MSFKILTCIIVSNNSYGDPYYKYDGKNLSINMSRYNKEWKPHSILYGFKAMDAANFILSDLPNSLEKTRNISILANQIKYNNNESFFLTNIPFTPGIISEWNYVDSIGFKIYKVVDLH